MAKCSVCSMGEVTRRLVTYMYQDDGQYVVVENVPAEVCDRCGERLFDPDTVDRIQKLIWSKAKPKRIVSVPILDLAAAS